MSQCTDISVQTDNKGSQSLSPLASPLLPLCLLLLSLFFLFPPLSLSLSFRSIPAFPWALCTCYPTPFVSLFPYIWYFTILSICATIFFSLLLLTYFYPTLPGVIWFWLHHNFFKPSLDQIVDDLQWSVFCWQFSPGLCGVYFHQLSLLLASKLSSKYVM